MRMTSFQRRPRVIGHRYHENILQSDMFVNEAQRFLRRDCVTRGAGRVCKRDLQQQTEKELMAHDWWSYGGIFLRCQRQCVSVCLSVILCALCVCVCVCARLCECELPFCSVVQMLVQSACCHGYDSDLLIPLHTSTAGCCEYTRVHIHTHTHARAQTQTHKHALTY